MVLKMRMRYFTGFCCQRLRVNSMTVIVESLLDYGLTARNMQLWVYSAARYVSFPSQNPPRS